MGQQFRQQRCLTLSCGRAAALSEVVVGMTLLGLTWPPALPQTLPIPLEKWHASTHTPQTSHLQQVHLPGLALGALPAALLPNLYADLS